MTPMEKTVDRIKKLLAKAYDGSVTKEEAAAFAAKASELAARESIELSQLDWEQRGVEQPIGRFTFHPEEHDIRKTKNRVLWQRLLCNAVCRANSCRFIGCGGNTFDIIGRANNVAVAAYLCSFLVRFAETASKSDYNRFRKENPHTSRRMSANYRTSWKIGFVNEVSRRLAETVEDLKSETGVALVRLNQEDDAVDDYVEQNINTTKVAMRGPQVVNREGVNDGTTAGRNVDVSGRAARAGRAPGQLRS